MNSMPDDISSSLLGLDADFFFACVVALPPVDVLRDRVVTLKNAVGGVYVILTLFLGAACV